MISFKTFIKKFSGAGVLPYCPQTNRYLLVKRSYEVSAPGTWATVGGEIDSGETPLEAALREMKEEVGFKGKIKTQLIYTYKQPNFEYFTFKGVVEKEFIPKLNWENTDYVWVTSDEFPSPLHPGIISMLDSVSLV